MRGGGKGGTLPNFWHRGPVRDEKNGPHGI